MEAAKLLGIGQPSLSESIQRLETDADRIFFYRSKSGIQLTPEGRVFLKSAQSVLLACRNLDRSLPEGAVFGNQEIVIGCHPTVAIYSLPSALAELKRKAPDFKVSLVHEQSRSIQAEVQRGRIDLGIVINPSYTPDLIIKNVGTDEVGIWSDKSESVHDTVICNPELIQTQLILKKWKKKPKKIISTNSLELICLLTARQIGYGIIPGRAVQISAPTLVKLNALPVHEDTIAIVYRPEFGKNLAEKLLIDALKNVFSLKR